ncbi:MAG TPA: hypothetical protein VMQ10_13485, partial [Spirochaetia bacterium]|nr:hypothetical protein [Spirochaetia bacterium]
MKSAKAREAARESSERDGFADFADETPFPVLRVSRDGTLLGANRGSWLLLEHWRAETGQPVPPDLKAAVSAAIGLAENQEVEIQIGFK